MGLGWVSLGQFRSVWVSSCQFSCFDAPNMSGHKSEPAAGPFMWIVDVEFQCCTYILRILSDAFHGGNINQSASQFT